MNQQHRFAFCMQVWGSKYVELFLNAGLAAQMVPGNLINFPWLKTSTYEIFTLQEDVDALESSPLFQKLRSIIQVNFHLIDDYLASVGESQKWKLVRHCHQLSAVLGDERDAGVFYLHPDQLWTQGSFVNAAQRIVAGNSAVLVPGPRTNAENMVSCLRAKFLHTDGSLPLPARTLIEIGMQNLHRETINWNWDTENFFKVPTYIYRYVKNVGLSAFCFVLHPLLIKPEVKFAPFKRIFDQDYLLAACPTFEKLHIVRDTDEAFQFELSPQAMTSPPLPYDWIEKIKLLAWYSEMNYNWQHRLIIKMPIRIHSTEINEEDWQQVEAITANNILELEKWWNIPDWKLVLTEPEHYLARFIGRHKFDPKAAPLKDKIYKAIAHILAREIYVVLGKNEFYFPGHLFTVPSVLGPRYDKYLKSKVNMLHRTICKLAAFPFRVLRKLKCMAKAALVG